MTTPLPRIAVAAPASGHGKTTVATGLMAALAARGHEVSGHKVGPDYIDPGYHAMATGRPGRNLDPFMTGEQRVVPLLLHGAAGADIAVIEGVMGLFDGRLGTAGESSTAHVAALTSTPVILVVDASHASRTHAAVVMGLATFDSSVHIAGVILNKCRTSRHADEICEALQHSGIPVLGVLPRDAGVETPSRHLGLVPAAERAESAATLARLAQVIEKHVDLDAVLGVAATAPPLAGPAWQAADEVTCASTARPVVAMAGGRAFTFRYAETEELLRAAGCEVVDFDPLTDATLPPGTAGIYLGGGFPEVHASELAGNRELMTDLRAAVESGVPTVAECAGLAYLCRTLEDAPAVGVVGAVAAMTPRLTLGYRAATSAVDTLLARTGEAITGHEFHRTRVTPPAGGVDDESFVAAWDLGAGPDGFATPTLHASYLHIHWAGHPQLAQRFADAVHARNQSAGEAEADPPRHHGDAGIQASDAHANPDAPLPPASAVRPAQPDRSGDTMDRTAPGQPVAPPPAAVAAAATERLANLATPPGALGTMGDIAVWLCATQGQVPPRDLTNVRLVVFAGDHGVAAHGVSAFPSAITGATVRAAVAGQLGVCALAVAHGVTLRVLDLGVDDDFADLAVSTRDALQAFKIRRSCGAIHLEDALTEQEVQSALAAGAVVARQEVDAGAQLLISGDLGIGNTTSAAALVAAGLGVPADEVVGRGSGIDAQALTRKTAVIEAALTRVGERADDPVATLAALGSADLAASTGYLLAAARLGVPVLLDGLMAVACALTADRIGPGAAAWYAAGHRSTEPAQGLALDKLGLHPLLDLRMRLGEGSGAVAAVPLLRGAVAVLSHTALLSELLAE